MAVLALTSAQKVPDVRLRPIDKHGKFRIDYFNLPAVVVAGDIGTTIALTDLPPGAVRVLPHASRLTCSAFGASRTLAIGTRAYASRDISSGVASNAEDAAALMAALDVSGAVTAVAFGTTLKLDFFSVTGIEIFATVAGGTIPVGATFSGYIAYIYE